MAGYFYCQHCGIRSRKNPRLKTRQKYCGQKSCQQSRKNIWERERLKKDPYYSEQRRVQKAIWREKRPAHQYQMDYRISHPDYVTGNRERQQLRNKNVQKAISEFLKSNIVKTDSLIAERPVSCGLYEILPYKTSPGKKIVKTDSLIVELRACRGLQKVLVCDSG
jgi:hypothetical protein